MFVTKKVMAQLLKRQVSFIAIMKFSDEMKVKIPLRVTRGWSACVQFINVMDCNVTLSSRPCVICYTSQPQH